MTKKQAAKKRSSAKAGGKSKKSRNGGASASLGLLRIPEPDGEKLRGFVLNFLQTDDISYFDIGPDPSDVKTVFCLGIPDEHSSFNAHIQTSLILAHIFNREVEVFFYFFDSQRIKSARFV